MVRLPKPILRLPKWLGGPRVPPREDPADPADQLPFPATAAAMEVAAREAILKRESLARDASESQRAFHCANGRKLEIEAEIRLVEGLLVTSVASVTSAADAVLLSVEVEAEARTRAQRLVQESRLAGADADSREAAAISVGKIASAMQKRKQAEATADVQKAEDSSIRKRLSLLKEDLRRAKLVSLKWAAKNKYALAMLEMGRLNASLSTSAAAITAKFEENINVRIRDAHEALGALNALEMLEAGRELPNSDDLVNAGEAVLLRRSELVKAKVD